MSSQGMPSDELFILLVAELWVEVFGHGKLAFAIVATIGNPILAAQHQPVIRTVFEASTPEGYYTVTES